MSTKFLSPGWRMPRNANQSKFSNYSMDFDGSQHIDIGSDISVSGNCTVSFWFKSPAIPDTSSQAIFARFTGLSDTDFLIIGLYLQGVLASNDSNLASSKTTKANITLVTDTWYHCVVTKVSGVVNKIYIDGTDRTGPATNPGESWSSQASNSGFIGQRGYGGKFIGQIDALAIFDYALSSSQVTTLWGGGISVSNPMALPSAPIAYYPLGTSAYNGEYLAENNAIGDYVFDFDADYIDLGSSSYLNSAQNVTVSAWINSDNYSSGSEQNILNDWNYPTTNGHFRYDITSTGVLRISIKIDGSNYAANEAQSFTFTNGRWYNVVFVYDGTLTGNTNICKLYIDGQPQTVTNLYENMPSSLLSSSSSLNIGRFGSTSQRYFNGKISNVQIFNTALSSTEAETLYNYGSPIRTLANIPQSSNLKAWYKLDASEVYNSTTTEWEVNEATSPWTSSLDFDSASSDYIETPYVLPANTTTFSVSMWLNTTSFSTFQGLIGSQDSSSDGYFVSISSYNINFKINGTTTAASTSSLNTNTWFHLVVTYDGSNAKVYLNNGSPVSNSVTETINITANTIIGRLPWTAFYYFNGSMSNISIWNTELTSPQVTEIYNNGTPSNLSSHSATSNLVSWWKLNNTTTGIEDSKGSNNGTNNGATEVYGSVSTLNGDSSGMSQANLVQSDLQTVAPYSKYALDFDAASVDSITINADLSSYSSITVSTWAKFVSATGFQYVFDAGTWTGTGPAGIKLGISKKQTTNEIATYDGLTNHSTGVNVALNTWYHITVTHAGTTRKIYLNGSLIGTFVSGNLNLNAINYIGRFSLNSNFMDGSISNVSIWNTDLTSAQITEIYNQGLPGNLNSHSAYSNLVSWWQLGENSSFDGNDWIVADEKGTNNGTSTGMPVGALVNGVGTTANGVSSGMSEGNLVGDAPYSTANAISTNMVVTSRVTGSGNTP